MKSNNLHPEKHPYTKLLAEVDKSIKSLYFMGNLPTERRPTVAIVGTRKPTAYGREVGYHIAYELARQGIVILSGLAYGMDAIAHQAALDAGGTTIAVLPTSLEAIYPASHYKLAQHIVQTGGALLTEYPAGTIAYKSNFIARNRIVSGLSDGLLIIEAAARSGTIATASFAINQGKPVMAVPGNSTSPMSIGCNNLIKSGARLVTNADEVLDEIGFGSPKKQSALPMVYTQEEQAIMQLMADGVRDGEDLQKQSSLDPAAFNQTMTMLELSGKIKAHGANQWGIC